MAVGKQEEEARLHRMQLSAECSAAPCTSSHVLMLPPCHRLPCKRACIMSRAALLCLPCMPPQPSGSGKKGLSEKDREELSLRAIDFADAYADASTLHQVRGGDIGVCTRCAAPVCVCVCVCVCAPPRSRQMGTSRQVQGHLRYSCGLRLQRRRGKVFVATSRKCKLRSVCPSHQPLLGHAAVHQGSCLLSRMGRTGTCSATGRGP